MPNLITCWGIAAGETSRRLMQGVATMSNFDRAFASGMLPSAVILLLATALPSCSGYSQPAVQTSSSKPTVSYVYGDDQGLLDATQKAETFCAQYGAWPTATGSDSRSDGRHVTFACNQPRSSSPASSTVVMSTVPAALDYPYRDDRGLIDAVNQAQRYCMENNANARSTRVINNADGSRTVSFECQRM
jgi:hypothetical protein